MPRKTRGGGGGPGERGAASMRPRPDAAENVGLERVAEADIRASMRPRPDAAENVTLSDWKRTTVELQ